MVVLQTKFLACLLDLGRVLVELLGHDEALSVVDVSFGVEVVEVSEYVIESLVHLVKSSIHVGEALCHVVEEFCEFVLTHRYVLVCAHGWWL